MNILSQAIKVKNMATILDSSELQANHKMVCTSIFLKVWPLGTGASARHTMKWEKLHIEIIPGRKTTDF